MTLLLLHLATGDCKTIRGVTGYRELSDSIVVFTSDSSYYYPLSEWEILLSLGVSK